MRLAGGCSCGCEPHRGGDDEPPSAAITLVPFSQMPMVQTVLPEARAPAQQAARAVAMLAGQWRQLHAVTVTNRHPLQLMP